MYTKISILQKIPLQNLHELSSAPNTIKGSRNSVIPRIRINNRNETADYRAESSRATQIAETPRPPPREQRRGRRCLREKALSPRERMLSARGRRKNEWKCENSIPGMTDEATNFAVSTGR